MLHFQHLGIINSRPVIHVIDCLDKLIWVCKTWTHYISSQNNLEREKIVYFIVMDGKRSSIFPNLISKNAEQQTTESSTLIEVMFHYFLLRMCVPYSFWMKLVERKQEINKAYNTCTCDIYEWKAATHLKIMVVVSSHMYTHGTHWRQQLVMCVNRWV